MDLTRSTALTSCKQWWTRTSSKKILLLLIWQVLFIFSHFIHEVQARGFSPPAMILSNIISILSPIFVLWLADKTFGRYEVVKFGSIISFSASVFFYLTFIFENCFFLSTVCFSGLLITLGIGNTCFSAAILPFLTDQLIGATSDELSAVVQWYIWTLYLGKGLAHTVYFNFYKYVVGVEIVCFFAIPLALIIISDCLCQQWLDKTHKVTNPVKLIIQVLNYTRKHRYPERRSAFTYIDEEHPSRMDFGKDKFGGTFTEEQVEDVKTVLRLIPIIICVSFFKIADSLPIPSIGSISGHFNAKFIVLDLGIVDWLVPVIMVPLYRIVLYRFFHRFIPSLLKSLGISLLLYLVGYILLKPATIKGMVISNNMQQYLTCTSNTTVNPDYVVKWYFEIGQYLLVGVARTIFMTSLNVFVIAQSPDRMKGLVLSLSFALLGINQYAAILMGTGYEFTLCHDITVVAVLVIAFVVYLILSKRYILRERNREINIQAIVEEHYERYMDQEEEYIRQQHY